MATPPDKKFKATMKTPMTISLAVHGVILLLVIFGLPYFKKDMEIVEPVPIDLVADISELTTTNKPPVKAKPVEQPKKEEKPPPKKEEPPKPVEQKEPPKPEPKPPEPVKEEPKLVQPEEKVDELGELEKKEPPKEKPKPEQPQEEQKDFDSLLKNLSDDKPEPTSETTEETDLMTEPSPSPNVSRVSDVLTMSEMDALRQQLAGCWNIMSGAANAEDLSVEVRVVINPDRSVASAEIVDKARYANDTFFRSMAESAIRAVKNPRCTPLRLPPDKYNLWNKMTIVFDPKEMF